MFYFQSHFHVFFLFFVILYVPRSQYHFLWLFNQQAKVWPGVCIAEPVRLYCVCVAVDDNDEETSGCQRGRSEFISICSFSNQDK